MEARIARLEQVVSDLRCDVIKLQTAERIATCHRDQWSIDAREALTYALYAISMIGVGVFLGLAIAVDPNRDSGPTQEMHAGGPASTQSEPLPSVERP